MCLILNFKIIYDYLILKLKTPLIFPKGKLKNIPALNLITNNFPAIHSNDSSA